ncbi:unnamed protein product [Vitrella brassicaformis CCMP3155]|uniref:Uncharacterized protein n=1 Tax=Vitrella brassicaformis (strain CCMP3155) TaxID=1169540 RepID=A0A0G4EHF7_VITBC|nr:unnamed protein product [Vitrella brassicaformis CCMP3155]|eukprot:CEL95926.1 unnamed protein product [Vitrella brassicaformis CCMP3155]
MAAAASSSSAAGDLPQPQVRVTLQLTLHRVNGEERLGGDRLTIHTLQTLPANHPFRNGFDEANPVMRFGWSWRVAYQEVDPYVNATRWYRVRQLSTQQLPVLDRTTISTGHRPAAAVFRRIIVLHGDQADHTLFEAHIYIYSNPDSADAFLFTTEPPVAGKEGAARFPQQGRTRAQLRADADLLCEGIQQLQKKIERSCDVCPSGGELYALVRSHFGAAKSAVSALEAVITAASLDSTQQADDAASPAAAAAAAGGGGSDCGFADSPPEEATAQMAVADADLSAAASPQPSYRIKHRSGLPPPDQPLARLRLSADELARVFGFTHPWELTRRRRVLGKTIFTGAAANYTHLTIDASKKGGVRRLWERMPLKTAFKWGQRAIHLTHLHLTRPHVFASRWCRGVWVALLEGNAAARKAINDNEKKKRRKGQAEKREEGGEEGSARPAHHVPQPASSIKVLSFDSPGEEQEEQQGGRDTSADPLPASPSPVDLSQLEEVHKMPWRYAGVRTGSRVWHTPHLRVLTLWRDNIYMPEVTHSWTQTCGHLQEFDEDSYLLRDKQDLLSKAPSLPSLQSIGPIDLFRGESGTRLEDVSFERPPASSALPDNVPAAWRLRCPLILRLGDSFDEVSKADVRSYVQFISICRPVHVHFSGWVDEDELEGEDQIDALRDLRSLAWECFEDLKALYTMAGGSCELNLMGEYWLRADLVAKWADGHTRYKV